MRYEIQSATYYERDKFNLKQPKQGWRVESDFESAWERLRFLIADMRGRTEIDKALRIRRIKPQGSYDQLALTRKIHKTREEAEEFLSAIHTAQ